MFLDEAEVEFRSGKGGSGAVSFHREKYVPLGGPNGSDGGRGGDVVLVADRAKRTLIDFKLQPRFMAEDGVHAVGNKRGKDGKGVLVKVPVGTIVTRAMTGERLVDLLGHGMRFIVCKGGRGGKGNQHYTTSVRQAPNFAEKGEPSENLKAKLELKLLADVGLVGLPNAGKSTLIAQISAARPKIADYPFTTLAPNLGVVRFHDTSFVVADLPGLIEGASRGVGLGHQFLRHVERTRLLVHIVDILPIDCSDPVANYQTVESELKLYSEEVWARPRVIALNKIDLLPQDAVDEVKLRFQGLGPDVFPISAVSGQGVQPLLQRLADELASVEAESEEVLTPMAQRKEDGWQIVRTPQGLEVRGKGVERMVEMTDLDNDEALRHLHRRLERMGVIARLREQGAEEGETVIVGEAVFAFTDER
ncbi:MAG: GTPase ObgE [Fimbriimonas ginsengisoli]|uniref:GTPase Obg n=1 Tax=Fimbriimonas ginsengisoli TaxID=1005039 RepID=A0A931LT90_FIMGI|nr:GTPase ObgE [Fimbriimonas ginsengisoli]